MIRMHVALDTARLDEAITFYSALFDQAPSLAESDYARFVVDSPALVLTLNAGQPTGAGRLNHMGIRLEDTASVNAARSRVVAAGLTARDEANVDCCYALQDKIWLSDPDGNAWEIYTVLQADTRESAPADASAPDPGCCPGRPITADCAPEDASCCP